MLDENVLVVDIDPDHWTRLLSLFEKEKTLPDILLLLIEQNECLKALHLNKGAIRNFHYGDGDLKQIARREGVEYIARIDRDFFQNVFEAGQENVFYDDDYIRQMITIYNGVINYTSENILWHPARPKNLRPLDYEKIQKLFNRFIPDGKTVFFSVIENGKPYTSLIIGKRSGDISLITTLDSVSKAHEPFDPRFDMQEILDEIAEKFEKVHIAFVVEKRSFEEMLAGSRPVTHLHGALANQRAFLYPMSLKIRLLLWAARVFKKL